MVVEDIQFVVTHFYRRSPYVNGWIQADFITQIEGLNENHYYIGTPRIRAMINKESEDFEYKVLQSPIDLNKIHDDIKNGSLMELPSERNIVKGESIWITPDQSVYIANSYDPDKGRQVLVYTDNVSNPYSIINHTVTKLLQSDSITNFGLVLNPYLSKEYWQILLSIILKNLTGNKIKESAFYKIGFIFPELDRKYGIAFTKLMNELNAAYSNNGLLRFQLEFEFVTWSIMKPDYEDRRNLYKILATSRYFKTHRVAIEVIDTAKIELETELF